MTELKIVTLPDEVLRTKARPVTKFDDDLQTLIDDMIATMRAASGVGLAAPQIGRSIQLAVIETLPKSDEAGNDIPGSRELFVIANPRIVWESREVVDGVEGCLSIPGYVGEVERAYAVRVRAQDRRGNPIKLRLKGWTARIFQHEIDHLNGVLYIDKLTDRENFWTDEEYYEMRQAEAEAEDTEEDVEETAAPENRD
ncbi:MAG: peptide deformylase [Anaerolineae bacterium]|nr:peptide deformylase [Anaerolineae bacterium]